MPLFSYLNRLLPNQPSEVGDLFQQTWVKAISNWAKYDERQKFFAWLCRIAHNLVMDMYRANGRAWWNTHYWTQFFNRKTPVFTGAERLARKLDTEVWYFNISRKSRGHYHCEFQLMFEHTKDLPEFAVTERYMRLLEDNIKECPDLWLWTHNRWKRNFEEFSDWLKHHPSAGRPRD